MFPLVRGVRKGSMAPLGGGVRSFDFMPGIILPDVAYTNENTETYWDDEGILQIAAADTERFDHDPTDTLRKNFCLQSEDLSTTWLTRDAFEDATITTNQAVAPDGAATADEIIENSDTAIHRTRQDITILNTTVYTWSVYAKKNTRDWIKLSTSAAFGAGDAWFDLTNGVIGTSTATSSSIQDIGNGWYRCSITKTSTGTSAQMAIQMATQDNEGSYAGDGSSSLYLWGAQLEVGASLASYIPTTTVPVHFPLSGLGLIVEGAAINLCTKPRNMNDAAWNATNITPAQDAEGVDDVANKASTLTATAANGTIIDDLGSIASAEHTYSARVKRKTGTGRVDITVDGGSTWQEITALLATGEWERAFVTQTLIDPDVGFRIVTDTDAIIVDMNLAEAGPHPTSEIVTGAATRAANTLTFTVAAPLGWVFAEPSAMTTADSRWVRKVVFTNINTGASTVDVEVFYTDPADNSAASVLLEGESLTDTEDYAPASTTFDGATAALVYDGGVAAVDSRVVTYSFWVKTGNVGRWFLHGRSGSANNWARFDGGSTFEVLGRTSAPTQILFLSRIGALAEDSGWHHVLFSVDMAQAGSYKLYVDDVALALTEATFTNGIIDHSQAWVSGAIACLGGAVSVLDGSIAEIYINYVDYLDLSVAANRRKFTTSGGKPIDLGATGAGPTGTQPFVYIRGDTSTIQTNLGFGDDFTDGGGFSNGSTVTGY